MNEWECPECGHKNRIEWTLCPCGFLDTTSASKNISSVFPDPLKLQSPEKNIDNFRIPPYYNCKRLSILTSLLDIASWKYGYSRWMLLFFLAIFIYRRTTDGLWFISYVAIAIAGRFEARNRFSEPFIAGKTKRQSIREFGYCRAIVDVLLPIVAESQDRFLEFTKTMFRGVVLTMLILHIYVGFVIACNAINIDFTNRLLIILCRPFADLLSNWPSFQITIERLISHGYGHRVPIVSHVYIVSVIGCIALTMYWFSEFRKAGPLIFYYDERRKRYNALVSPNIHRTFIGNIKTRLVTSYIGEYLIVILAITCMALSVHFLTRLMILFPGEPAPRHGKYIWLASYVYKDDLGLFSIVCYLLFFFFPIPLFAVGLFEPFYRIGCTFFRFLKRQK